MASITLCLKNRDPVYKASNRLALGLVPCSSSPGLPAPATQTSGLLILGVLTCGPLQSLIPLSGAVYPRYFCGLLTSFRSLIKCQLIRKEKGETEDEIVGWYQQLNGRESEQTPGDLEWQGILACCSPWGRRVGHDLVTEQQQQQIRKGFLDHSTLKSLNPHTLITLPLLCFIFLYNSL